MEENKNTKIHNKEREKVTGRLRRVADSARDLATRLETDAKYGFYGFIHDVVDAVIRGGIDSISIYWYNDSSLAFYICNNNHLTSTAFGIEDVERVINEALAAEKTEEAEQ
jgi:hypothetical protein